MPYYNEVSFKSRARAGFSLSFDPSSLSVVTKNRVRKWLAQGYCEASHGYAASIASWYFPGIPKIGRRYSYAAVPKDFPEESRYGLQAAARLIEGARKYEISWFTISGYREHGDLDTASFLIRKLANDPYFDAKKAAALGAFERSERLVLVGGTDNEWRVANV